MDSNVNIFELHDWLKALTDEHLLRKLMEYGCIPKEGDYQCKKCKNPLTLREDKSRIDKFKWFCDNYVSIRKQKKVRCGWSVSVRTGTFFEKSQLSLEAVLKFIHFWVYNTPLNLIRLNLRIAQHTAVDFGNFCREIVYEQSVINSKPLGGPGMHVEIDESKFGKRKYNKGHRVEGQWVFGGYERGSGEIFMVPVEKRDRSTLLPIIERWILPGTTVHSDFWKAYDCLDSEGYNHLKVNHSIEFVDAETGACTNHIEASWRVAKKHCDTGGRKKEFFGGYLAKYMFLKRCRSQHLDPFFEFLRLIGIVYNVNAKEADDAEHSEDEYNVTESAKEGESPDQNESAGEDYEFANLC